MNVSSGSSGIAIRRADRLNLTAFASGLNNVIAAVVLNGRFRPSKNSWA